ncbi:transporter substrate-binding domain-containing protein [Streptomyces sp. B6B3]|uniref:transporter substrate-binding domain-containing protein n=1 Tax=Streptomyces sp. B6B3 TaxID=3153570 RepID=UPI00325F5184
MTRNAARSTRLATVLVCLAAACGSSDDDIIFPDTDRLVIAVKNDQPGTGYAENTLRSGLDIQLARELTADLRGEDDPNWDDVQSETRTTVITGGRADLVIATMSITEDREDDIDFIGPYARTQQGFMVRDEDVDRITSLDDLRGERICTWSGTTSTVALDESPVGNGGYEAEDASNCIAELRSGEAFAISTDQLILYGFAEHYEELAVVPDLTVGSVNNYGIGIAEDRNEECERIAEWLKDYVNSGDWDAAFTDNLGSASEANPQWQTLFRPDASLIDTYSCQGDDG